MEWLCAMRWRAFHRVRSRPIIESSCIHPFPDGNGRMARLMTVLLLDREEYEVARYVSLKRLIEETRESCYDTLYRAFTRSCRRKPSLTIRCVSTSARSPRPGIPAMSW